MPFQCPRPEQRAQALASASSSAARDFYTSSQSTAYTTTANASIQKDLTRHALELLYLAKCSDGSGEADADGVKVILDLGAGSGLSTRAISEWFLEHHVMGFTLGFDISTSMLALAAKTSSDGVKPTTLPPSKTDHEKEKECNTLQEIGFYCGNAAQRLPIRSGVLDAAIGISMLQWLTPEGLEVCFASLHRQLVNNGRAVFQVYPPSIEYVDLMEATARRMGFASAEVFVSFPHATPAKKWFFCVDKRSAKQLQDEPNTKSDSKSLELCSFGRRFHRRCGWYLLQGFDDKNAATSVIGNAIRERLEKEHVKEAWHVWRKYRRSRLSSAAAETSKEIHAKAKRSLELWKSDEVIGQALETRFVPSDSTNEIITHNFLLERVNEVVDILHSAYTTAVEFERFAASNIH